MPANPTLDDLTIIQQLHNNDDSNLETLISRHSGIYYGLVNSIMPSGYLNSEMKDECSRILYEAAESYDESKGAKFSTWAYQYTKYNIFDTLKEQGHIIPTDIDEVNKKIDESTDIDKEKLAKEESLEVLNDVINQLKDKKMKQAVKLRFFNKKGLLSFKSVGREMGISHETARHLINNFVKLAKNKLESKAFCDVI